MASPYCWIWPILELGAWLSAPECGFILDLGVWLPLWGLVYPGSWGVASLASGLGYSDLGAWLLTTAESGLGLGAWLPTLGRGLSWIWGRGFSLLLGLAYPKLGAWLPAQGRGLSWAWGRGLSLALPPFLCWRPEPPALLSGRPCITLGVLLLWAASPLGPWAHARLLHALFSPKAASSGLAAAPASWS